MAWKTAHSLSRFNASMDGKTINSRGHKPTPDETEGGSDGSASDRDGSRPLRKGEKPDHATQSSRCGRVLTALGAVSMLQERSATVERAVGRLRCECIRGRRVRLSGGLCDEYFCRPRPLLLLII